MHPKSAKIAGREKRRWPRLTKGVLATAAGGAILVGLANAYVLLEAGRSSDRVADLPHAQVAIVPPPWSTRTAR